LKSSASRSSPSSTKAQQARPSALAAAIDLELDRHRNPARAPREKAYLKSDLEFLGVGLPAMRDTVRALKRDHAELDHRGLVALASLLWRRRQFERRMMAVLLLEAFEPLLQPADMTLLERLIRQSKTWAFVDELAIVITGPLVERSPELLPVLDRWAVDGDSGYDGRRCWRCSGRYAADTATSCDSRDTPTPCSENASSSSGKRSAGYCARPRRNGPTWFTGGSSHGALSPLA
jgi:hypothetical protein